MTEEQAKQSTETFVCDRGRTEIKGFKIAEVRAHGVALIVVGCDFANCHALHMHLLMQEENGELFTITTFDTENQTSVTMSGILFRALSKLVYNNYDVKNVMPGQIEPRGKEEWKGTDIIPGLTPWGKD